VFLNPEEKKPLKGERPRKRGNEGNKKAHCDRRVKDAITKGLTLRNGATNSPGRHNPSTNKKKKKKKIAKDRRRKGRKGFQKPDKRWRNNIIRQFKSALEGQQWLG